MNHSISKSDEPDMTTRYFNIYVNLFFVTFGNIGNLLQVVFFLQKPLRSCACSVFILVSTFSNFAMLNNVPIHRLLSNLYPSPHWVDFNAGWSKNEKNKTIILSDTASCFDMIVCKVRAYFQMLSISLSFQMLLLASINRFCSSWRRKKHQQQGHYRHLADFFCHLSNAYKLSVISSLVWAFISLQHAFNYTIVSRSQGCVARNLILWTAWVIPVNCFLLPTFIILFGTLTLKSMRTLPTFRCLHSRRHYQNRQFVQICHHCTDGRRLAQHQIETQLTLMIIAEIIVTILTSFPYAAYYSYHFLIIGTRAHETRDPNTAKLIELLIRMTVYLEPSCGFYIYLMTLSTLRKRFSNVLFKTVTSVCGW